MPAMHGRGRRTISFFDALAHRDFRIWWATFLISTISTRIQTFSIGWLVVLIAAAEGAPEHAALYLGLLGMARAIPAVLLGLFAGVAVDRIDRRTLLMVSHFIFGVTFLGLGITALTGNASLWAALAASGMYAATSVLYIPTRQAIQAPLVGERDVRSAIGLVVLSLNTSAFIAPLLGGVLIVQLGVGTVMLITGVTQLLVAASLGLLSPYPMTALAQRTGLRGALVEGLGYVRSNRPLFWLLVAYFASVTFIDAYTDLLPALASNVLRMGPVQLSWLVAAAGIGSLVAGIVVASLGRLQRHHAITSVGAMAAAGVLLALFVRQRDLLTLLLIAGAIGFMIIFAGASINLVIQTTTPDHLRGRVNSLFNLLTEVGTPGGALLLGVLATAVGIDQALTLGGLVVVAVAATVGLRRAAVRVPAENPSATREASVVIEP
jgi:predicted MFS family arabinose efflux permease